MAISNVASTSVRYANTAMGLSFFSTQKDLLYPKISRVIPNGFVSAEVTPFSIPGAAPFLQLFQGNVTAQPINDFKMYCVSQLYKAQEQISREAIELDNTQLLQQRPAMHGSRLAQWPEMLMMRKILTGYQGSSTTQTSRDGVVYPVTMDGVPFFSTSHVWGNAPAQSNVIVGNQPATFAAYAAQNPGDRTNAFQKDLQLINQYFGTLLDDKGVPLFPNYDSGKNTVIVSGQRLKPGLTDAFTRIQSGQPILANQTSVTAPAFIRDVYSSGFLDNCPDIQAAASNTFVTPEYQTEYYAVYLGHTTSPFYWVPFNPIPAQDVQGANMIKADIENLMKNVKGITLDQATQWASTYLETNFDSVGNSADTWTMMREAFLITPRARGTAAYGFPGCAVKIIPSGGNPSSSNG